jgi:hypothetical protein
MALDPFLMPGGSGSATCPDAQSMPPARRGLRCRHVPHGIERTTGQEKPLVRHVPRGTLRATRQERVVVLPPDPRHRAHQPAGEGSEVTMHLMALGPPPVQEGSSVVM